MKKIKEQYYSLLKAYYAQSDDSQSFSFSELSSNLVKQEILPEEIAELHKEALVRLKAEFPDFSLPDSVNVILEPLIDLLKSYGLAYKEMIEMHKKVEKSLTENEKKLKVIFETAPDAIYLHDQKGIFLDGNKAAEELLGFKKEELIGKNFFNLNLLSLKELSGAAKVLAKNIMGKKTGPNEYLLNRKDGSRVPVEINSYPAKINNKNIILGIARDISIRKKIEQKLRDNEQLMSLHINQTPLGVIEWDINFKVKKWNPSAERIFGFSQKEALGKHAKLIVPQSDRKHVDMIWRELLKKKGGTRSTNKNVNKEGNVIFCEWYNTPLVNEQGKVIAVTSLIADITESERTRENMIATHMRLIDILENMNDAFVFLDKNWCYIYMNENAGKIFNRDPQKMIGKHIWTEFPEGVGQPFYFNYQKAMEKKVFIRMEEYYPPYDKWFENRINPTKDGIAIFFTDITAQKKTEKELIKHRANLKELVKERTAELEVKNLELEKFNELFIGREFRIKGLREKLKKLEKQLQNK